MIAVFNAVFFPFADLFCCFPEISAIESPGCLKSRRFFNVFKQPKFAERGSKFSTEFYKSGPACEKVRLSDLGD